MGPDRERLGHVHQAPVAAVGGLHGGQGGPDQSDQEPLQSLAPDGILVNTVSPGTFASESFKAALAEMPGVDENDLQDIMRFIKEGFGHAVFLDRAADPSEIGPVIAFVASARNTYMTGANLNVDGGSDFS